MFGIKSIPELFEWMHKHPPKPFNPEYDPYASSRYQRVTASMEEDGYYRSHTRAECAVEWRRRYESLLAAEVPSR